MWEMGVTEQLVRFVLDTDFEDIPQEAIHLCKRLFMDCIGAALAAVVEPIGKIMNEFTQEVGGTSEARLIGTGLITSLPNAAYANGTLAHAISFDDTAPSHPSVTIIPVLLALGEKYHLSGKELLAAQTLGYEVFQKFNSVTKEAWEIRQRGWHPTGFFGAVAASLVAAKLLELNMDKSRMAIGIAASLGAGLTQNIGTMTMPLHAGNAARNGLVAAMLAQKGFTADNALLEGRFGLLNALCGTDNFNPDELVSNLGSPFHVIDPGINIKFYPSCWAHHRAVDAMLYMVHKYNLKADDVESIECDLQPDRPTFRYLNPKTDLEAKYSLNYSLAVSLLDGKLGIEQFSLEKITDPKTQEVLNKVKHVPQPFNQDEYMVKVRLKNGREYSYGVKHNKGLARVNPLTQKELEAKYRICASRVLAPDKVERSIWIMENLEEIKDITELMDIVTSAKSLEN